MGDMSLYEQICSMYVALCFGFFGLAIGMSLVVLVTLTCERLGLIDRPCCTFSLPNKIPEKKT